MYNKNAEKTFSKKYELESIIEKLEIPYEIKTKLKGIKAKIVLPKKGKNEKVDRFNVYVKNAKVINGEERICYIKIAEPQIIITEYKGARGERFSGLYPLLREQLKRIDGYEERENKVFLSSEKIDDLIKCISKINEFYEDNELILKRSNKSYIKYVNGEKKEMPISYFEYKQERVQKINMGEFNGVIVEMQKVLAEGDGTQFIDYYKRLKMWQNEIDQLIEDVEGRKILIEKSRGITL